MSETARRITLDEWDRRYAVLRAGGLCEPAYGGPLGRHVADGNSRLLKLRMDNSPAALRLWNFLLSEEERLHQARKARQTARRHDEGPGDRARDGLLSGRHRGVLRRRRLVAAVPHGEPDGDAGIGRPVWASTTRFAPCGRCWAPS